VGDSGSVDSVHHLRLCGSCVTNPGAGDRRLEAIEEASLEFASLPRKTVAVPYIHQLVAQM